MSGIQRFLTKRGERHKRSAKQEKEAPNPSVRSYLRGLVINSASVANLAKEDEQNVKSLKERLAAAGIIELKNEQIRGALTSEFAQGDVEKAFDLLIILEDSIEGILRDYDLGAKLVGAVNRKGVTCYLDSVLFAMFAQLDFFEAILYKPFTDHADPRRKLAIILRLWVNMLRSGNLITTDITEHLQESLAECGWKEAAEIRQQDASEAFAFITEKLELPLLTLKMDIYHTGREDAADDHKFINERLLEVAIPPEHTDGTSITLEECLEAYFNNKIEVRRHLERRGTVNSVRSFDSTTKGASMHVESIEVGSVTASPVRTGSPKIDFPLSGSYSAPTIITRQSSIVQERFVPDKDSHDGTAHSGRSRKGSYRKEVMMPAWQFFSLIPWYTDNTPTNDAQVAAHFASKRPILGMCLKRYSVLSNGNAIRLNTYIDIPTQIGLPHFIQDDRLDEDGLLYGNFKLLLQSVVCHRGNSVDSGHYIALVRNTNLTAVPPQTSQSLGSDSNSLLGSDSQENWMRFDDLAPERVSHVNIEQALREESPYLLFYQIVPVDKSAATEGVGDRKHSFYREPEDGKPNNVEKDAGGPKTNIEPPPYSSATPPASVRLSFDLSSLYPPVDKTDNSNGSGISDKGRNNLQERRSLSLPRPRKEQSRSRSRGADQPSEKGIGAAFSRLTVRMSRDKILDESGLLVDADEGQSQIPSATEATEATEANDEKRGRESAFRKENGKQRQRSRRERSNPDRECVMM